MVLKFGWMLEKQQAGQHGSPFYNISGRDAHYVVMTLKLTKRDSQLNGITFVTVN